MRDARPDLPPIRLGLPPLTPQVRNLLVAMLVLWAFRVALASRVPGFEMLVGRLMLQPSSVLHGSVWQLLSYPLVQPADLSAVFGSALSIYLFGTVLEGGLGGRAFLLLCAVLLVGNGVLCTLFGVLAQGYSYAPVHGAFALGLSLLAAWGTRFSKVQLAVVPIDSRHLVWLVAAIHLLFALLRRSDTSPAESVGAIGMGYLVMRYWPSIERTLAPLLARAAAGSAAGKSRLRVVKGGASERGRRFLH